MYIRKVSSYAPASIGNFAIGFDIMGLSITPYDNEKLGDVVEVLEYDVSMKVSNCLVVSGNYAKNLPELPNKNIVYHCLQAFNEILKKKNIEQKNIQLHLIKNLPIGSGLGSSASSVVASLSALNYFYNKLLSADELLILMGDMEEKISGSFHLDNVAPSFLGGLQLILSSGLSKRLEIFESWLYVMAYSGEKINTFDARSVLPQNLPLKAHIEHTKNLSSFLVGLQDKNENLVLDNIKDVIVEPNRRVLMPNLVYAREELKKIGCLNTNISGAGPTIFNIVKDIKTANTVKTWLEQNYINKNNGFVKICKLNSGGAVYTDSNF